MTVYWKKDYTALRKDMTSHLSGKRYYYEYMRGERYYYEYMSGKRPLGTLILLSLGVTKRSERLQKPSVSCRETDGFSTSDNQKSMRWWG